MAELYEALKRHEETLRDLVVEIRLLYHNLADKEKQRLEARRSAIAHEVHESYAAVVRAFDEKISTHRAKSFDTAAASLGSAPAPAPAAVADPVPARRSVDELAADCVQLLEAAYAWGRDHGFDPTWMDQCPQRSQLRAIGESVNTASGLSGMEALAQMVAKQYRQGYLLSTFWDGIGEWRA